MIWIIVGGVLAVLFILLAHQTPNPVKLLALGLLIAALIYVGFALFGGGSAGWVAIELVGVAIYGLFAGLGVRHWVGWLAAGWLLHVSWDVGLHQLGAGSVFTPAWYPPLCIGFDVVVALWLVWLTVNLALAKSVLPPD